MVKGHYKLAEISSWLLHERYSDVAGLSWIRRSIQSSRTSSLVDLWHANADMTDLGVGRLFRRIEIDDVRPSPCLATKKNWSHSVEPIPLMFLVHSNYSILTVLKEYVPIDVEEISIERICVQFNSSDYWFNSHPCSLLPLIVNCWVFFFSEHLLVLFYISIIVVPCSRASCFQPFGIQSMQ